ncbi:MAG: hypothetical protein ACJ8FY_06215 [Gemmataceae bacterium]
MPDFTINDYKSQIAQMKKMGSMRDIMTSMPGMARMIPSGEDPDVSVRRIESMIDSMTRDERCNREVIDSGRCRRIAAGSGTEPQEVNDFVNQFEQVRTLLRKLAKISMWERIK